MINGKVKKILLIVGGATAGYAYYRFIGCATGACPLSSNPYVSTAYGAIIGLILGRGGTEGKKNNTE